MNHYLLAAVVFAALFDLNKMSSLVLEPAMFKQCINFKFDDTSTDPFHILLIPEYNNSDSHYERSISFSDQ